KMERKEAYERLELPEGSDLQEVRRKFAEIYNDYQMRIDNPPTPRMRQTYEQHLETVKEAYALLNGSDGMDDTGDLPRTGQTGSVEEPTPPSPTGVPPEGDGGAQAVEPQAPAPSAKKHRGAVPYVLGIAVVVLVGVLVWKFAGNGGVPDDGGNGAVDQSWQPTHYISSRLGEEALVLRKRELTADEQQQVTTDAALNGETYAATLRAGDSIAIVAEAEGYYTVLAKGASGERYYLPREAQTDDWLIKLGEPEKEVTIAAAAKREREAPVEEPEPVAPPAPKPKTEPVAAADPKPAAPAIPIPEAVYVAGGTFQMGSNDGEDEEQPLHSVTLSSYRIGKYEVTFAEYD